MLYRIVRSIHAWLPLAVLWLCLGGFLLAFPLMFVFPQGTLLLLFTGLFGLGAAVLGSRVLHAIENGLVRISARRGKCPRCLQTIRLSPEDSRWQCESCGSAFATSGNEITP